MQIVIVDGGTLNPGDLSWEFLSKFGEYKVYKQTDYEQTIERCCDADIVVTNKVVFDQNIISSLPKLKFITVTATGYNNIDIPAANDHKILVSNVPDYSTQSVAQTVFALLLELAYHVGYHAETVAEGRWSQCDSFCYWDKPLIELSGKTMGIIGFGRIGQRTANLAKAFGMKVIVYKHKEQAAEDIKFVDLDEVFIQSDVLSLHCPLTDLNKDLICGEKLQLMKKSAFLINTARGPLVNENDLASALNDEVIAGAGLDVLASEPPKVDNPLLKAKNCYITPHIAWASKSSRERMMQVTCDNIKAFMSGQAQHIVSKNKKK